MALPEWQARVVEERVELSTKIRKLEQFLFADSLGKYPDITEEERFRLKLQLSLMRLYEQVLEERVGAFLRG